jgi:hypothetical protein
MAKIEKDKQRWEEIKDRFVKFYLCLNRTYRLEKNLKAEIEKSDLQRLEIIKKVPWVVLREMRGRAA